MPKSYYPPMTLKSVLAISDTIFKNGGKPIFRVTLAEEMNYKSESRTFRDLITASAGYGLTTGSHSSEKIVLEELGHNYAQGNLGAIYSALFSIEVFKKFYDTFGGGGSKGIPSEKVSRDFLHNECGIPEAQSKAVLDNVIQDAKDWLLIQNIAGGEKFVPVDLAKEKMGVSQQAEINNDIPENTPKDVPATGSNSSTQKNKNTLNISPNLQLNIQIHIAADTPDEKIETIFKNMRTYLLNNGE